MKYAIIIMDGAAGPPADELDEKTPLQAARLPILDSLAAVGRLGTAQFVSAVGQVSDADRFLSLLGYDPMRYPIGEGVLTAKARGIAYNPDETVFCCDFVTTHGGRLQDPTAGMIGDAEVRPLIASLNEAFSCEGFNFFACSGHRALCKWKTSKSVSRLGTSSPISMLNESLQKQLSRNTEHQAVVSMLQRAQSLLEEHEINLVRQDLGENTANAIWLWGDAPLVILPSFAERHGLQGCLLEQNDVLWGLGKLAGMEVCGFPEIDLGDDASFASMGDITADAIGAFDLVTAHLAAPGLLSQTGKIGEKVHALELIDRDFVKPVLERLGREESWRLLVIANRADGQSRSRDALDEIMFVLNGDEIESHRGEAFDEQDAMQGEMRSHRAHDLMDYFLHR